MPTLTVRRLDEATYNSLKTLANQSGRSMEAEARAAISRAVGQVNITGNWLDEWTAAVNDDCDLPLPRRSQPRPAPDFSEFA
jgi:antitoxin FitA